MAASIRRFCSWPTAAMLTTLDSSPWRKVATRDWSRSAAIFRCRSRTLREAAGRISPRPHNQSNPRGPIAVRHDGPQGRDLHRLESPLVSTLGDLEEIARPQDFQAGDHDDGSPGLLHGHLANRHREDALVGQLRRGMELELVEDAFQQGGESGPIAALMNLTGITIIESTNLITS